MVRHLRNSRRLEKPRNLDLNLRDFVYVAEDVGNQERVSARRKEVIVNTDLRDLEDLCPAFGKQLLRRCPRRDEGPRRGSAGRETQLVGQASTLLLSGWAFWYFADDEDLAWNLEVGNPANGELAYIFRGGKALRPQYDSRGDVLP